MQTPYVRLLALPGINVVLASEFAGEAGPMVHYATPRVITGRAGMYPRRYQSDEVDLASGRWSAAATADSARPCSWPPTP